MSRQPSSDLLSNHDNYEETNHVKHRNYWTEKESYNRCDDNMCNDQLSLQVQLVREENDMKHRNYLTEKENYGRYDERLCDDRLSSRHVQLGPEWLESNVATMNDSLVKPSAAISSTNARNNVDIENSNLECQICFRRFYHVRNLRNHLEQHNNAHYRCPMGPCRRVYDCFSRLAVHARGTHRVVLKKEDQEKYYVGHRSQTRCERISGSSSERRSHSVPILNNQKREMRPKTICKLCHRKFRAESAKHQHEKEHSLMKFRCPDPCGYMFYTLNEQKAHAYRCHRIPKEDHEISSTNTSAHVTMAISQQSQQVPEVVSKSTDPQCSDSSTHDEMTSFVSSTGYSWSSLDVDTKPKVFDFVGNNTLSTTEENEDCLQAKELSSEEKIMNETENSCAETDNMGDIFFLTHSSSAKNQIANATSEQQVENEPQSHAGFREPAVGLSEPEPSRSLGMQLVHSNTDTSRSRNIKTEWGNSENTPILVNCGDEDDKNEMDMDLFDVASSIDEMVSSTSKKQSPEIDDEDKNFYKAVMSYLGELCGERKSLAQLQISKVQHIARYNASLEIFDFDASTENEEPADCNFPDVEPTEKEDHDFITTIILPKLKHLSIERKLWAKYNILIGLFLAK